MIVETYPQFVERNRPDMTQPNDFAIGQCDAVWRSNLFDLCTPDPAGDFEGFMRWFPALKSELLALGVAVGILQREYHGTGWTKPGASFTAFSDNPDALGCIRAQWRDKITPMQAMFRARLRTGSGFGIIRVRGFPQYTRQIHTLFQRPSVMTEEFDLDYFDQQATAPYVVFSGSDEQSLNLLPPVLSPQNIKRNSSLIACTADRDAVLVRLMA